MRCEKVLVTGGAGFMGSHLVTKLLEEQGIEVFVLDDLSSGYKSNVPVSSRVRFVEGDVSDNAVMDHLVKKCKMVFHLAEYIPNTARYGPGHVVKYSVERPVNVLSADFQGMLTVLEKCRKYKKKIILSSTAAVYGEPSSILLDEDEPTLPSSPYGASKLCCEACTRLYSTAYDLPVVIARLFNVYGPRQRKYVLYDLLVRLQQNSESLEVMGTGEEKRDLVFVNDAVEAITLVADHEEAEGKIFNIGTGVAVSMRELVQLLLDNLEIEPTVGFSGSSWKGNIRNLVADVTRIKALGFEPRYTLSEGIGDVVKWFFSGRHRSARYTRRLAGG